jgi:hypothetical protein
MASASIPSVCNQGDGNEVFSPSLTRRFRFKRSGRKTLAKHKTLAPITFRL